MSMYADYLKERTTDEILENELGFASYRYTDRETVYIVDIYVKPEARKQGRASEMADTICKIAQEKGCKYLLGTVVPSTKGSSESLQTLLAYGMRLDNTSVNLIVLRKDI